LASSGVGCSARVRIGQDAARELACRDDVIWCRSRASGTGHTLVAGRGEHKQLWSCMRSWHVVALGLNERRAHSFIPRCAMTACVRAAAIFSLAPGPRSPAPQLQTPPDFKAVCVTHGSFRAQLRIKLCSESGARTRLTSRAARVTGLSAALPRHSRVACVASTPTAACTGAGPHTAAARSRTRDSA
jgi:hypothetical protein